MELHKYSKKKSLKTCCDEGHSRALMKKSRGKNDAEMMSYLHSEWKPWLVLDSAVLNHRKSTQRPLWIVWWKINLDAWRSILWWSEEWKDSRKWKSYNPQWEAWFRRRKQHLCPHLVRGDRLSIPRVNQVIISQGFYGNKPAETWAATGAVDGLLRKPPKSMLGRNATKCS